MKRLLMVGLILGMTGILRAAEKSQILNSAGPSTFLLYFDDVSLKALRLCAIIDPNGGYPGCGYVDRGNGQGAKIARLFPGDGVEHCLNIPQQGNNAIQLIWNEAKQKVDGFGGNFGYPFKDIHDQPHTRLNQDPQEPCNGNFIE